MAAAMESIVSVQVGEFSNFIGTHLWNLTDEEVGRENNDANRTVALYHEQRSGMWYPRVVMVGPRGFVGEAPFMAQAAAAAEGRARASGAGDSTTEALSCWDGMVEKIEGIGDGSNKYRRPHLFARRMFGLPESGESASDLEERDENERSDGMVSTDDSDDEDNTWQPPHVSRLAPGGAADLPQPPDIAAESKQRRKSDEDTPIRVRDLEDISESLSATVHYISDFMKAPVDWESCAVEMRLSYVESRRRNKRGTRRRQRVTGEDENSEDVPAARRLSREYYGTFHNGKAECMARSSDGNYCWSEVENLMRNRLEESDIPSVMQVLTDWKDGFGGIGSEVIQWCREEVPKTPVVVMASSPPDGGRQTRCGADLIDNIANISGAAFVHHVLEQLEGHNSPLILSDCSLWQNYPPSNVCDAGHTGMYGLLKGFAGRKYDCAAVVSTALASLSAPYVDSPSVAHSLFSQTVPTSLPLFSAALSLPLPSLSSATRHHQSYRSSSPQQFPIRPLFGNLRDSAGVSLDYTPGFWDMADVKSGASRLGNPYQWASYFGVEKESKGLFQSLLCLPREVGSLLYDDSWTEARTHIVPNELPLPLTFPRIFKPRGDSVGDAAAGQAGGCLLEQCGVGTIVHAAAEAQTHGRAESSSLPPRLTVPQQLRCALTRLQTCGSLRQFAQLQGIETGEFDDIYETLMRLCEVEDADEVNDSHYE